MRTSVAVAFAHPAAVGEIGQRVGDEKRIAGGLLLQLRGELVGVAVAGEGSIEEDADLVRIQPRERDLAAAPLGRQLMPQPDDRILRHDRVDGAIGHDDQQTRRIPPCRQSPQQADARMVAPVQVLEHQDQRTFQTRRDERRLELALQPFAGCRRRQLFPLRRRQQLGNLLQPGRRKADECGPGVRAGIAQQRHQCVEDRAVGLDGPELLDALPVSDQGGWAAAVRDQAPDQLADQPRLANAGLAGHQHHFALAGGRAGVGALQVVERVGTADEAAGFVA